MKSLPESKNRSLWDTFKKKKADIARCLAECKEILGHSGRLYSSLWIQSTEQTQAVSQHRLSPALKRRRHGIWGPLISHHVSVGGHKKSTGNVFHIWNYGCYKCNHGQVCGCVKRSRNDGIQVRQWKSRRRRAPLMWSLVRPHCHSRQRLISQCSIHGTTESCSPTPV